MYNKHFTPFLLLLTPITLFICLTIIGVKVNNNTINAIEAQVSHVHEPCPLFELPSVPPPPTLPYLTEEQLRDKGALSAILLNHVKAQSQYYMMVDRVNKDAYERYRKCHVGK